MVALRAYQQDAVAGAAAAWAAGARSLLAVAATGTGKTTTAAELVRRHLENGGRRVLVMAQRRELLKQLADRLESFGVRVVRGLALHGKRPVACVTSVQSVARRLEAIPSDAFDLVVLDECFPAGTQVDGRAIETLRVGDTVRSYNHETGQVEPKEIRRLFCSRPQAIVTVCLDDGRQVVCTAGHPFWTTDGYRHAAGLKEGDELYGHIFNEEAADNTTVHGVSNTCNVQDEARAVSRGEDGTHLLLGCLSQSVDRQGQFETNGTHESKARERSHDHAQPDAPRDGTRKDEIDTHQDRAQAEATGWEWNRADRDGTAAVECSALGLGLEPHLSDGGTSLPRLSDALQAGPSPPSAEGIGGGRWFQSLRERTEGAGRKETAISRIARVVRVEVHERRSQDGFGGLCPGDLVYNIEVADNHNYFVDGILVHNCHHAAAPGHLQVLRHFPAARVFGMTATPDRADGASLGLAFDQCVSNYGIEQAIADGYLVPARGVRVEVDGLDLSKVRLKEIPAERSSEGAYQDIQDLNQKDLGKAVIAPAAVEGVVGPLLELTNRASGAPEDLKTLVFAVDVRHARAIVSAINAKLPNAARAVWGAMKKQFRDQILRDFAAGEFQYLVNVMLLVEGWDLPAVQCVAIARPTTSRIFVAQACGRALRPAPGKREALILDFTSATSKHTLIGPEDVLGGAMEEPMASYRARRAAPPLELTPYAPVAWGTRFTTAVVDLMRRAARAIASGEAPAVVVKASKRAGGAVARLLRHIISGD